MSYWTLRRKVKARVAERIEKMNEDIENNSELSGVGEIKPKMLTDTLELDWTDMHHSPGNVVPEHHSTKVEMILPDIGLKDASHIDPDHETFSSSFSDTDSDSQSEASESLEAELAEWAVRFNVSHVSLSALLAILRQKLPELPKDPRTLLGTVQTYSVQAIAGGSYYHFGIAAGILAKLNANPKCTLRDEISLQINIDGLPLFKSSNTGFWPILGMVDNPSIKDPFVIGLFYGNSKPVSASEFLSHFVDEMKTLQVTGLVHSDRLYKVALNAVICDAPARAHSGYSGCDKCTQSGEWDNKIVFPETNAALRTDIQFDKRSDKEHHLAPSPFQELKIGMVSQFPLDYMHLVCLGVMRRLLWLWRKGPLKSRIGLRSWDSISSLLVGLVGFIPKEFARRPRSLREVDRWKATEFRQFLLYTGPVVLLDNLSDALYKNFLLFHVALSILVHPTLCLQYGDYAHDLLVLFVIHYSELYGRDMVVYNVHSLVHLANDVKSYGCLDNFSSFPFENFMQALKKMVRKPKFPLQQVIRRLSEREGKPHQLMKEKTTCTLRRKHNDGPTPHAFNYTCQYRAVSFKGFNISTSQGDNCVRVGNDVALVRNILQGKNNEEIAVLVEKFVRAEDYYTYPVESSKIGISKVAQLSGDLDVVPLLNIKSKCVLLPHKLGYVAMPFHC